MIKKILLALAFSILIPSDIDKNYEILNNILDNYVNENGKVDYDGLINNPYNFNDFFYFLEKISPENKPELFNTEDDEKAYWINAYNAIILKIMIDNPGMNILDINIIGHSIWFKKFTIGGKKISPFKIENKILRKKYKDPRIHFAINCASTSCPPLGARILTGKNLNEQLNQKASIFINNNANVKIDNENKTIYLNKIFKWFKKDFLAENKTLNEYIFKYINKSELTINKSTFISYKIKFIDYDWSINSQ